jgi:hypothetical protein
MEAIFVTLAVSQAPMFVLKVRLSAMSSSIFVTFETSQTPMAPPYSASAEARSESEIHKFTAVCMLPARCQVPLARRTNEATGGAPAVAVSERGERDRVAEEENERGDGTKHGRNGPTPLAPTHGTTS